MRKLMRLEMGFFKNVKIQISNCHPRESGDPDVSKSNWRLDPGSWSGMTVLDFI